MAELLTWAEDQAPKDYKLYDHCYKQGDVIVVCEDGWGWTKVEIENPRWRILKMPGPVSLYLDMVTPKFDKNGLLVIRRELCYDPKLMPAQLTEKIEETSKEVVQLTAQEAVQVNQSKVQRANSEVIG